MDELINYNGYEEFKQAVNRVLNRTVEDFVLTGYLLKQARDTDILQGSGYNNVNEFAWGEYKLDASQVSRYIRVNDKFSEGGYSPKLQDQYQGFGYAKLALMLTLPEEVVEELTPAYSKTEIQAVKEEIEEEEKITDIEVILEGQKEEQKDLGNLEKALHQIFHDEPELYKTMHETVRTTCGIKYLQEVLAPDGDKIYSTRIQGIGRIMIYMHESKDITLHMVRSGDKEFYSWDDALSYCTMITDGEDAEKTWEEVYGEEFPKKEEIAPVQPKKRKESKVVKAKKPERKPIKTERPAPKTERPVPKTERPVPKTERSEAKQPDPPTKSEEILTKDEEKQTETPDTTTVPAEAEEKEKEKTEETPEVKPEFQQENTDETQIPGQTELTKDFPEYCPPDMNPPEEIEQPPKAYKTRHYYMANLPEELAAVYMAKTMERTIRKMTGMSYAVLTKGDFWKEFLGAEVDWEGNEIECAN